MNELFYPIIIPIVLGTICFLIPRKVKFVREFLALIGSVGTFGLIIWLFLSKPLEWSLHDTLWLRLDDLSGFLLLASGLFGFLITLYSLSYMHGKEHQSKYYGSLLWTLGAASGALLANHLVLLLIFWGFLGITLYLLILTGGENSSSAAKKSLVIIGGSDALILLSIALIYILSGTLEMDKILSQFEGGILVYLAFFLLALGIIAKIGAIPLHTWVPDMAEKAPLSASALLPGSLDKLLGIYLLARICMNLFNVTDAMSLVLLIIGSLTIIVSAMMGLLQSDARKMLGYLVITGAGYMIIGFGTDNALGMAGGLFYMINSALWTQCLFLVLGCVEHKTGHTKLSELGGLARLMPLTFIVTLVAAFSISGIPPFNGFAAKWMIYQGLIDLNAYGDKVWVIWLVMAMFGSALTLAVCAKFIHSIFLGIPPKGLNSKKIGEVGPLMALPISVLALICIVFGIFADSIPLKHFVFPIVPGVYYFGLWSPDLASLFILLGLLVGFIVYLSGNLKGIREVDAFIGGEHLPVEERVTGVGFYQTIRENTRMQKMYSWAEAKWFDVYHQGSRLFFALANLFRKAHTGVLNSYLMWVVMGLMILLIIAMMGR